MAEVLRWLTKRLCRRSSEVRREKDRNHNGTETVLGWLELDEYVFLEKIKTVAAICPDAADMKEIAVIDEQLRRMTLRCRGILQSGRDPFANAPFTGPIPCLMPRRTGKLRAHAFREAMAARRTECDRDEMTKRFRLAARIIRDVAAWIENKEFGP